MTEPKVISKNDKKFAQFVARYGNTQLLCNNSVHGGDCYGETYCNDFECNHKVKTCECNKDFDIKHFTRDDKSTHTSPETVIKGVCGCCWHYKRELIYIVCPYCNTIPKDTEKTMGSYWDES